VGEGVDALAHLHCTMGIPVSNTNYQVYPFFEGTDKACTNAVYFLPPSFTYGEAINFSIPLLFGGTEMPTTPTYGNDDFVFTMQKQGSGAPSQSNVLVNITLTGTNMWKCASSARVLLMENFVGFLQEVEARFELTGYLIPGATYRIGQWIADRMVAPLAETLFYRYSLSTGFQSGTTCYVNVQPGMQLRLETEASQYLTPGGTMNGYVSGGRFPYVISSVSAGSGPRTVTLDAFLGTINSPTITGATTSPVVAGGVIDTAPVGSARAYCRLFYPSTMAAPSQPGSTATMTNVTMISAQTLAQLNGATAAYPACTEGGSPPNVCTVFMGRAIAVPEVPVWITARGQTQLQYVSVGTTIANIIERFTMLPLNTGKLQMAMLRLFTNPADGSTTQTSVTLFTQGLAAISSSMLDLPLIAADGITLTF
jgi:hypothetical protein